MELARQTSILSKAPKDDIAALFCVFFKKSHYYRFMFSAKKDNC